MKISKHEDNMRILCFFILVIIAIIDILPFPITALLLILILLFRPRWFYDVACKIYDKHPQ
jgi:hypothetical protein